MGTKFRGLTRCLHSIRLSAVCAAGLLVTGVVLAVVGGGVDDPNGPFQLEGNATTDSSVCFPLGSASCTNVTFSGTSDDWDKALGVVPGGHSIANTGVVVDLTNSNSDDIFTGGSSKDTIDLSQWLWKGGKPQAKDDIAHAFAAAYTLPNNHTAIYFGLDRYDNSGSATAGFWFFQDSRVAQNNIKGGGADGGFNGTHKEGDLLIVSDFSTGGAVATIQVFEWQGGDGAAGHLQAITPVVTSATCNPTVGSSTLCAIVNPTTQSSPWSFGDKSGSSSFLHGELLEGGIDLNAIFGNDVPCFTTFMAETRSSNSPTATLSDFSPPHSFPLCGIAITKSCPQGSVNSSGTGFSYKYNGTVTNTGIGTLTNIVVTDHLPSNATNKNPNPPTFTFASLAPHACIRWPGGDACNSPNPVQFATFDSATNGPLNSASVSADTGSGTSVTADSDADPSTPGNQPASCPTVEVNPTLSVSKVCDATCLISGASTGDIIRVNFHGTVCNTSNVQLTGVTVTDHPDGTIVSGSDVLTYTNPANFGGTLGPAGSATACASFTGSYKPTSPLDANLAFTDHLTATGTSPLGGTPPPANSGTKSCPVCPLGNCP